MWTPIPGFFIHQCFKTKLRLTKKYSHLKFIEEANNEADKARKEVEFWEMIVNDTSKTNVHRLDGWMDPRVVYSLLALHMGATM